MTTEIERLQTRLTENGIRLINVFPGTNTMVTKEELAAEMNRALDNLLAGDYTEVSEND